MYYFRTDTDTEFKMTEKAMPVSLKGITSTNDDPSRCVICSEMFPVGLYQCVSVLNVCCGSGLVLTAAVNPVRFTSRIRVVACSVVQAALDLSAL